MNKTPLLIGLLCFFLQSCYNYGTTHTPYEVTPKKHNLAPPPTKIVAEPLTKNEYITKAYKEIKSTLQEAEVDLINDSIKILFPNNILYKPKEELPSSDYMNPMEKLSRLLKKYVKTNIIIAGHTDNKGKKEMNRSISQIRADNIKTILVDFGCNADRFKAFGMGDISPVADNFTEEGRKINRRVEFIVLYRD